MKEQADILKTTLDLLQKLTKGNLHSSFLLRSLQIKSAIVKYLEANGINVYSSQRRSLCANY
ncbi:hypothetical protein NIES4075_48910 [Tolypothrix sp. NIES-4075]|uniref:hypothetical protein n=1 Tax=Tolypothrix sp. NIES-4075 TaxID=2005459 RepID=UPI000B726F50|nr:hypothetical protein [Tolypothrix sp. NIES-4075]GAX43876.1 hypothetical protein NIES4075_48910 [Tolypothrix sp. NIES-4075]